MPDADSPVAGSPVAGNPVAYGRYLMTMVGCADCHTRRTLGRLVKKTAFANGITIDLTSGTLRSDNITPAPEMGIGS